MRVGEHSELFQVGHLTQIDLFGELAPDRAAEVFVVAHLSARQRPFARLRLQRSLPEQHAEIRFAVKETADLEYDGEHVVLSATIRHVFDCRSKTDGPDTGGAP